MTDFYPHQRVETMEVDGKSEEPGGGLVSSRARIRRPVSGPYFGSGPRFPTSLNPARRFLAYRTRHLDAALVVQPTSRAIALVATPAAASNTICALKRVRCSVFVERTRLSSSARSAFVRIIGVASELLLMQL